MNKLLKKFRSCASGWRQRSFLWLIMVGLLLVIIPAACSTKPETIIVEVTRVVTETIVEEGELVAVTRVVIESQEEAVEEAPEAELDSEPPSATGSEGDAEPLPPPPDSGPKVAESRGSTEAAELAVETAVTLRANQISNEAQTIITANGSLNATALQKWCEQATRIYKKRCG